MEHDVLNDSLALTAPLGFVWSLERYFWATYEFLPHATAQKKLRVKAKTLKESDPVTVAEYLSEIDRIDEDAVKTLPKYAWGGFLVSLYAGYENGIAHAFDWLNQRGVGTDFERWKNARGVRTSYLNHAERYSAEMLGIKLYQFGEKSIFEHMRVLRNSYAHEGSSIARIRKSTRHALFDDAEYGFRLRENGEQWVMTATAAWYFYSVTKRSVHNLSDNLTDKHIRAHSKNG